VNFKNPTVFILGQV